MRVWLVMLGIVALLVGCQNRNRQREEQQGAPGSSQPTKGQLGGEQGGQPGAQQGTQPGAQQGTQPGTQEGTQQQGGQGTQQGGQQGTGGTPSSQPSNGQTVEGTESGVITEISHEQGIVTIRTSKGVERFHAKPSQIGNLKRGEMFTAQYATYGGQRWLMEHMNATPNRRLGRITRVTGNVVQVNQQQGRVIISTTGAGKQQQTLQLMAHPADLAQLSPGEFVTASYQRVGTGEWLVTVTPAGSEQQGQRGMNKQRGTRGTRGTQGGTGAE